MWKVLSPMMLEEQMNWTIFNHYYILHNIIQNRFLTLISVICSYRGWTHFDHLEFVLQRTLRRQYWRILESSFKTYGLYTLSSSPCCQKVWGVLLASEQRQQSPQGHRWFSTLTIEMIIKHKLKDVHTAQISSSPKATLNTNHFEKPHKMIVLIVSMLFWKVILYIFVAFIFFLI